MKKRSGIYILGGVLLCGVLLFLAYIGVRLTQGGERPVVVVQYPFSNLILDSGEGLAIVVYAESDAGLEKISLFVDGELYTEESGGNENSLTVVFPWYAETLGGHTLEVKAIDRFNRPSDTARVMVGVEASKVDTMDYEYIPPQETAEGGVGTEGSIVPTGNGDRVIVSDDGNVESPPTDEEIALLPHADDVNPSVTVFIAEPGRNGHQVQIRYHIEVEDDLGVDYLEISVTNTTTGETSSRTTLCFGEPVCAVEDVYPFASAGVWLIQAQAIDTSGQSSAVQTTAVEIVENPGFDPAIGILDPAVIDRLITNWMQDGRPRLPMDIDAFEPQVFESPGFPAGALATIQMDFSTGYVLEDPLPPGYPPGMAHPVVHVSSFIPPVPEWHGYENLLLVIKSNSLDLPENQQGDHGTIRGNPQSLRITEEIIANGFVFETNLNSWCGGLYWDVHWELLWNGQLVESGPIRSVRTAPCLPSPSAAPVITSLQGYSDPNVCNSGATCTVLTWQPSGYPIPTDPAVELPITSLIVYRWAIFHTGRLDALQRVPDLSGFLDDRILYVPLDSSKATQQMLCIPPNSTLTYAFTLVPMKYIGPGENIYSNDGTTMAYIDACQTLPYNTTGTIGPR